jgi:hypothetical protein
MLRTTFLTFIFVLLVFSVWAQNIQIKEDPAITTLLDQFVGVNKTKTFISGWRVQILATTDRVKMETTRDAFKAQYPYLPVTWVHERPYYLLRAGAFTNKLDAMGLQQELRAMYPSTYLTQDNQISPVEMIGYQN